MYARATVDKWGPLFGNKTNSQLTHICTLISKKALPVEISIGLLEG